MAKQPRVKPIREKKATIPDEIIKNNETDGKNPRFKLEIADDNLVEALNFLKSEIANLVKRGRYHKIRIKRHGKPVLPDIPIGAFAALEAATFLKTGPLRMLFANVLGKTFFEVELINEAQEAYQQALDLYLKGELDEAIEILNKSLSIEKNFHKARLQLGIIFRVRGLKNEAAHELKKVIELAKEEEIINEAKRQLDLMMSSNNN